MRFSVLIFFYFSLACSCNLKPKSAFFLISQQCKEQNARECVKQIENNYHKLQVFDEKEKVLRKAINIYLNLNKIQEARDVFSGYLELVKGKTSNICAFLNVLMTQIKEQKKWNFFLSIIDKNIGSKLSTNLYAGCQNTLMSLYVISLTNQGFYKKSLAVFHQEKLLKGLGNENKVMFYIFAKNHFFLGNYEMCSKSLLKFTKEKVLDAQTVSILSLLVQCLEHEEKFEKLIQVLDILSQTSSALLNPTLIKDKRRLIKGRIEKIKGRL